MLPESTRIEDGHNIHRLKYQQGFVAGDENICFSRKRRSYHPFVVRIAHTADSGSRGLRQNCGLSAHQIQNAIG